MKQIKRILGNRKGTTLTSVLVAFVVLMVMASLFYQSVRLALNLIDRADAQQAYVNSALADFYRNGAGGSGASVTQSFTGGGTAGSFTITMKERTARYGDGDVTFYCFEP